MSEINTNINLKHFSYEKDYLDSVHHRHGRNLLVLTKDDGFILVSGFVIFRHCCGSPH